MSSTPSQQSNQTSEVLEGLKKQMESDLSFDFEPLEETTSATPIETEPSTIETAPTEDGNDDSSVGDTSVADDTAATPETVATDGDDDEYDAEELFNQAQQEATTAPVTPTNPSEVETLRGEVSRLSNLITQMQRSPGQQAPQAPEGTHGQPMPLLEFVTPELYNQMMESPEELNKAFNQIHYASVSRAIENARVIAAETIVKLMETQNTINGYMELNADLKPHDKLMGLFMRDAQGKDPNKSLEQLLNEAATATREQLKKRKAQRGKLQQNPNQPPKRGAFARVGGGRPGQRGDIRTELQRELDEL